MSVRCVGWFAWAWAIVGMLATTSNALAATPAEVELAIKKGVQFLYSVQSEEGNWDFILKPDANGKFPADVKQSGGPTALAVYALLTAGENPKDPRIVKAYDFLKKTQSAGTYAIGFRANAFALFPMTDELKRLIAGDAAWIKNAIRLGKDVKIRGFYGYGSSPKTGSDRSTSQVAVLGAWGCAQIGDSFGDDFWKIIETAWKKAQLEDGGWNYSDGYNPQSTIGMTASGVATLFITQEILHRNDFSECRGSVNDINIEKGLKYLGEHFDTTFTAWPYYTLFAIERCGAASGYKAFGTNDWFNVGADWLVKQQNKETGSWEADNNPSTSFALLFLARGRSPVAVIKLAYTTADVGEGGNVASPTGANWDQRPREVSNVCRWVAHAQERALNFQVASIDAPVESLQDAPVLYISGNQPLKFSEEKTAKLKKFIEEGGLIIGNADCSNKQFADSFKKLGQKMFPTYEFRVVPTDHPMFYPFPASGWKVPPNLMGLSNGSRELMLLFPTGDPAKYWQLHQLGGHEEMHQVMADILGYAADKEGLRHKGETHLVVKDATIAAERTMKVARLQYAGNWDPEPGSWRRMASILHNEQKIDMTADSVQLGEGKLDNTFVLAHLTGTAAYKLTDKAKAELKQYVESGGTLLVDACGGESEFATDFETQLTAIFGVNKDALALIPLEHKLYATEFPGELKIATVEYRPFARKALGTGLKTPRLRGIEVKGRTAVFFSREDLSTGMVGEPIGGVLGYSPASATAIVQHVLSILAPPKPEPKPAAAP